VGGILRDIFTMGARPIAVMDSLRFGPLDDPLTGPRNRRILEGVVSGIAHYGNCFGVPTVGGECIFEPSYSGNPLVNVFALGVFKKDEIFYARASGVGNPVIYVGAKTGRDGIHGASMASAEFSEESSQKRPNVQVGDPFMEKLLLEACLEAMQTGAIVGIQDMGAAGLTCSTCEMGSRGGVGIEIDLQLVPQRATGMTPYEIMLSESQERMLLVAEKGREGEVLAVYKKWGLDAVIIGEVTGDGMLRVRDHGTVVVEIPNRALADEAPLYDRPHSKPAATRPWRRRNSRAGIWGPIWRRWWPAPICARSAGSGSSTTTWCAPTPYRFPAATRPSCGSRRRGPRWPWRWTATGAMPTSLRGKRRAWRWPSAAATCR